MKLAAPMSDPGMARQGACAHARGWRARAVRPDGAGRREQNGCKDIPAQESSSSPPQVGSCAQRSRQVTNPPHRAGGAHAAQAVWAERHAAAFSAEKGEPSFQACELSRCLSRCFRAPVSSHSSGRQSACSWGHSRARGRAGRGTRVRPLDEVTQLLGVGERLPPAEWGTGAQGSATLHSYQQRLPPARRSVPRPLRGGPGDTCGEPAPRAARGTCARVREGWRESAGGKRAAVAADGRGAGGRALERRERRDSAKERSTPAGDVSG
jgi:hypothetical protein